MPREKLVKKGGNYNTPVNFKDLTGKRFGKLIVISRAENKKMYSVCWNCICECGKSKIIRSHDLCSGKTTSCGCIGKNSRLKASTTHGGTHTRLYRIWNGMRSRTTNPKTSFFYCYGGRGISVCEEWKNSFELFREWALSHGYQDNLSIDRINNDGNYEPCNCRWATASEQQLNKRKRGEAKNARKRTIPG